jgi:hypothetical protein
MARPAPGLVVETDDAVALISDLKLRLFLVRLEPLRDVQASVRFKMKLVACGVERKARSDANLSA